MNEKTAVRWPSVAPSSGSTTPTGPTLVETEKPAGLVPGGAVLESKNVEAGRVTEMLETESPLPAVFSKARVPLFVVPMLTSAKAGRLAAKRPISDDRRASGFIFLRGRDGKKFLFSKGAQAAARREVSESSRVAMVFTRGLGVLEWRGRGTPRPRPHRGPRQWTRGALCLEMTMRGSLHGSINVFLSSAILLYSSSREPMRRARE